MAPMSQRFSTDVLIIGGGVAGLAAALHLADSARVTVLAKGEPASGSSFWAQGGIAAVLDDADCFTFHEADTVKAGADLCDIETVRLMVREAPDVVRELSKWGVDFDKENNQLHLTMEGGHSHRRVAHVADATGREITQKLSERVLDHHNIEIFHDRMAIDLINLNKVNGYPSACAGAHVLNTTTDRVEVFQAKAVVIATGGASKVYLYTSNPDGSTGDGIAMAYRAGCRVANMEFNQFHPTCLYHPHAGSFLISEAVRGEGGILTSAKGYRFMPEYDERAELAPRDIVARAIDQEMKKKGLDCVYLDISHRSPDFIKSHFPNIHHQCQRLGIDITQEPIPVVPAAHYTCGGVLVDADARTDLDMLFAIGEVAYSGLHGANRLASNSLLECLVHAKRVSETIKPLLVRNFELPYVPKWDESRVKDADESIMVSHNWDELRRFMWDFVGIVRTDSRLERAKRRIDLLNQEVSEHYGKYRISSDLIELRNLLQVANLIVRSAMMRKESRGLHYNLDYPETLDTPKNTLLSAGNLNDL